MDDITSSIIGLLFLLIIFAIVMLLVWLYETAESHLVEAWESWQQGQSDIRKSDDIQMIGIEARDEIDQIMAYYRQQVDDILQTEGINPETPPEIVLLATQKYKIQEDTYDS